MVIVLLVSLVTRGSPPARAGERPSPGRSTRLAGQPAIQSPSAVLIDAHSGVVLFDQDGSRLMAPASITKILTAALVLEHAELDDVVAVSEEAAKTDGSSVYLEPGERATVRDLLYSMMMNSANDAAVALAEYVSGSVEGFAGLMNAKVAGIGALQTHFENPHGLDSPGHLTTARDMALIAMYAMRQPFFREVVGTRTRQWEGQEWSSLLVNHNRLLWQYDGCTGVKTGFTTKARHTLVASAMRDGNEMIAVLMGGEDPETLRREAGVLFDYGFTRCLTRLAFAGDAAGTVSMPFGYDVPCILDSEVKAFLPEGEEGEVVRSRDLSMRPPQEGVRRGQVLGRVTFWLRGVPIAGTDVVADRDVTYTVAQKAAISVGALRGRISPRLTIPAAVITLSALAIGVDRRVKRRRMRKRPRLGGLPRRFPR